jgi:hypothetical protein
MPRPKNLVPSDKLRITITPPLRRDLEVLVESGRFGMNINEAIHRLISYGIAAAFREGREVMENKRAFGELVQQERARP